MKTSIQSQRNAFGKADTRTINLAGGLDKQITVLKCSTSHVATLRLEIRAAGLALRNTNGATQLDTLLRVLQYLGPRGINTPEGEGCGYLRIATRIQELRTAGWSIASLRENIIGTGGLRHHGIARYVLIGRTPVVQTELDFGQ